MSIQLEPIGTVRGGRAEFIDENWGEIRSCIELNPIYFGPEALVGLEGFSHVVVLYHLHRADPAKIEHVARHPRNNPAWPKIGIFAQRGRNRPNALGVSTCRVLAVEGTRLLVQGLDAVDGTPVLDVKPLMKGFEPRGEIHEPGWAGEIMSHYW